MKKKPTSTKQPKLDWRKLSERRLKKIISIIQLFPGLAKLGPKQSPGLSWGIEVQLVGNAKMIELNSHYRGKNYATDVLSFPTLPPFRQQGILGDLVICLPTLKSQAKALGLKAEVELDVLLTHGVLHLLGFDHEAGEKEAAQMARWEAKILAKSLPSRWIQKGLGLIDRSKSDT
jgi:rRNA maturation RNase YbeY